jgi:pyruvate dehydrogenase E1 component
MHQKRNERVVDLNPQETAEWVESLEQVIEQAGPDRAAYLLEQLTERARAEGADLPIHLNTPYINTIRPEDEVAYPGDRAMERRIKSLVRWNAMAMVVRQNKYDAGIGGHISTYASLATLLEVGFNHFFHASYDGQPGDLVYFQGHASPGVYARAFLEGRLSEEHLQEFPARAARAPGPLFLSAPVADAGFLELPHGVDGPGADQRHLPGALHAVPGKPRLIPPTPRESGASWAMAKWTSRNPWAR